MNRDTLLDLWHGWFIHQIKKNQLKFRIVGLKMAETKFYLSFSRRAL